MVHRVEEPRGHRRPPRRFTTCGERERSWKKRMKTWTAKPSRACTNLKSMMDMDTWLRQVWVWSVHRNFTWKFHAAFRIKLLQNSSDVNRNSKRLTIKSDKTYKKFSRQLSGDWRPYRCWNRGFRFRFLSMLKKHNTSQLISTSRHNCSKGEFQLNFPQNSCSSFTKTDNNQLVLTE